MVRIGYCHADMHNWEKALATYHHAERLLKFAVALQTGPDAGEPNAAPDPEVMLELLPDGFEHLLVPVSYDPMHGLASLYASIAVAHGRLGETKKAVDYFQQSIKMYLEQGNETLAAQVWGYTAQIHRLQEDWENMQDAAEHMLALCVETEDINGRIDAWRHLAQAHTNQQRLDKAHEYFRALVAAEETAGHPALEDDRALLNQLEDLMHQHRAEQSEDAAMNPETYLARARDHILLHQRYEDALAEVNRALELDPDHTEALIIRTNAYVRLGRLEEALMDANRAIELDPDNGAPYHARGVVYEQQDRPEDALADYTRSIELDPTLAQAYNNRGVMYDVLGEHDKALADYYRAVELKPDYAKAYINIGSALEAQGKDAEASWYYEQAARLAPSPEPEIQIDVVLFTSDTQIAARIGIENFGEFLRNLAKIISAHFKERPRGPGFDLAYKFVVKPGRKLKLTWNAHPEVFGQVARLDKLYTKLIEVPVPDVKGKVVFELRSAIWGGAGEPVTSE
jgi:tetratricopeptide (TPR) repeat protein